tara:strand:+ start:172 stop:720 length:549 start_codon:yes stop_codon:yes gene_type:complete
MAIRTITANKPSGFSLSPGWKEATISKAKYGDYNGNKYLDIYFDKHPEWFNIRVYEAKNTKTQQEFRICNWFRFSHTGIQEVLDNGEGSPIITYDDDASLLAGMSINIFYYESKYISSNGEEKTAIRGWRDPAPIVSEGEHLTYTEQDVNSWKANAENSYRKWLETKQQSSNGTMTSEAAPF